MSYLKKQFNNAQYVKNPFSAIVVHSHQCDSFSKPLYRINRIYTHHIVHKQEFFKMHITGENAIPIIIMDGET